MEDEREMKETSEKGEKAGETNSGRSVYVQIKLQSERTNLVNPMTVGRLHQLVESGVAAAMEKQGQLVQTHSSEDENLTRKHSP